MGNKSSTGSFVQPKRSPNVCETCQRSFDIQRISRFWKSCTAGKSAVVDRHICGMCSKLVCQACARRRQLVVLCRHCCRKEEQRKARRNSRSSAVDDGPRPEPDDPSPLAWSGAEQEVVQRALGQVRRMKRQHATEMNRLQSKQQEAQQAIDNAAAADRARRIGIQTVLRPGSPSMRECLKSWAAATAKHCRVLASQHCAVKLLRRILADLSPSREIVLRGCVSRWLSRVGRDQTLNEVTVALNQEFASRLLIRTISSIQQHHLVLSFGKWRQTLLGSRELLAQDDETAFSLAETDGGRSDLRTPALKAPKESSDQMVHTANKPVVGFGAACVEDEGDLVGLTAMDNSPKRRGATRLSKQERMAHERQLMAASPEPEPAPAADTSSAVVPNGKEGDSANGGGSNAEIQVYAQGGRSPDLPVAQEVTRPAEDELPGKAAGVAAMKNNDATSRRLQLQKDVAAAAQRVANSSKQLHDSRMSALKAPKESSDQMVHTADKPAVDTSSAVVPNGKEGDSANGGGSNAEIQVYAQGGRSPDLPVAQEVTRPAEDELPGKAAGVAAGVAAIGQTSALASSGAELPGKATGVAAMKNNDAKLRRLQLQKSVAAAALRVANSSKQLQGAKTMLGKMKEHVDSKN